jgi:hypothetical protein
LLQRDDSSGVMTSETDAEADNDNDSISYCAMIFFWFHLVYALIFVVTYNMYSICCTSEISTCRLASGPAADSATVNARRWRRRSRQQQRRRRKVQRF